MRHLLTIIRSVPLIALSLSGVGQSWAQVPEFTDIILITGQSNVRASGTQYDSTIDTPHPQVYAFTSSGIWEQADLHQAWDINNWQPGNGALTHADRSPYNNFALHLGKAIVAKDPSRVVGFVMASAPGRGIGHWDPDYVAPIPEDSEDSDEPHDANAPNFYEQVMNKVALALAAQTSKTTIDAVIWHQGETDWLIEGTSDPEATQTEKEHKPYYKEKLEALIDNFRSSPDIAGDAIFICGETAAAPVNARLMALNYDPDFNTSCVPASDLGTKDGTHFNADGLRGIGLRYGNRYADMVNATPYPAKLLRDNTWEQIGLPADAPDLTVGELFKEQMPIDRYTSDWTLFQYDSMLNRYRSVPIDEPLQHGVGYWILQKTGEDRTIHMPYVASDTPVQTSAACASASGCFATPVIGVQSPTWNMLAYPFAQPGIAGTSRLILSDGVCAAGCTIEQADELNLIQHTLWSYQSEQNQYVPITAGDRWQPWSGFWMAAYGALGAENSALLTTQP